MATESIGSIGLTIEVEDINVKKVTSEIAEALDETTKAAEATAEAADAMADEVKQATAEVEKETKKMADEVEKATDKAADAMDKLTPDGLAKEIEETADAVNQTAEETKKASETMINLSAEINKTKAAMAQLALEGDTTSEAYMALLDRLGQLLDVRGDIQAQGSIFSDDDMNIKALNQGVGTYQSTLSLLGDAADTAAGSETALTQAASAFSDAAAYGNKIQQIQNALNADGYIKRVLLTKVTKTQAAVEARLTAAFGGTAKAATAAKIATMGLTAAAAAATLGLPFLIMGIEKLIEKWKAAKEQQEKMAKSIGDATGDSIASIRKLQKAWADLGEDLKKKADFIKDNQDAFDDLGVSITNITEAENLLVANTDRYVRAIMARAKANAAQSVLNDKYVELVKDRADLEQELSEHEEARRKAEEKSKTDTTSGINWIKQIEVEQSIIDEIKAKIKEQEDKFNKENAGLFSTIEKSEAEAAAAMSAGGFADLDEFQKQLKIKEQRYKDYAAALESTDEEIKANAEKTSMVNLSEGANYKEYLTKLRTELKEENAKLDKASEEDAKKIAINEQKIRAINQELVGETKADKTGKKTKEKQKEELTHYQQLKALLKEYQDLREAGYNPRAFAAEEANLKKQIEEYERLNHLAEADPIDNSERIAKLKEFSDKLVAIVEDTREKVEKVNQDTTLSESEKAGLRDNLKAFQDDDIEMLKAEYGIVGEDLMQALMDGMKQNIELSQEDMVNKIIELKDAITKKSDEKDAAGNQIDNSQEVAKLEVQLQSLVALYNKLKAAATETKKENDKLKKSLKDLANEKLKKGIRDLSNEFLKLGDQIGGRAGDALNFVGTLGHSVMDTIENIQRFSEIATQSIEGASKATATAIKAVESASVILAVISTAMEVAMKIVSLFKKDKETYEDKKEVYDAYVGTLDIIIEREKELTRALEAQQAAASYDAIGENIRKQEESTRRIGKEYLDSIADNKHSNAYNILQKINAADWRELQGALGRDAANAVKGSYRLSGLFDLDAEQLKKIQEEATGFYSKLDSETRAQIENIIGYNDAFAQNINEKMAQLNNISFDEFANNFLDSLMDMDANAADISKNIQDQMRKALINDMFKEKYAGELNKYYEKWAAAMENDGQIDADEMRELNTLRESIVNGATAAAKAINDQFRDTADEIDEGGLSGAIKGASQESIDLLTGQTNAVRMNQVEAMDLAREQLSAVISIEKNVASCTKILSDIRSEMQNGQNSMRSQGLEI